MITRILAAIGGLSMLAYGGYGLAAAVRYTYVRMYLAKGGSDTVQAQIFWHDTHMSNKVFVALVYAWVLGFIACGALLCSFAFRRKDDHGG